jgi:hypothetical protein
MKKSRYTGRPFDGCRGDAYSVFEHYDMPGMTREGDVHVGAH